MSSYKLPYGLSNQPDSLRPYILASSESFAPLIRGMVPCYSQNDILCFDVLKPTSAPFYQLVNAGNGLAFRGIPMPNWVQFDCCTLPSFMIGYACRRSALPDRLWESLNAVAQTTFGDQLQYDPKSYLGWVPLSEYCALQKFNTLDSFIGVSLYTLLRGCGLGVRTKSLALLACGARRLIGITQYDNKAVRSHVAIGRCRILQPRVLTHEKVDSTFVYDTPDVESDRLISLVEGSATYRDESTQLVPINSTTPTQIEALMKQGSVSIVWPGHAAEGSSLAILYKAR